MRPDRVCLLLLAATLSACQALPVAGTPQTASLFRLTTAAPGAAPAAVDPASAPEPVAELPAGRLTIAFGDFLAKLRADDSFRLAEAGGDLDHVLVEVVAGDRLETAAIHRDQLDAGVVSHTFEGLPPGPVDVRLAALDAGGTLLAEERRTAQVPAPGQAPVEPAPPPAAEPAAPTAPAPVPARSGGGRSGSSSAAAATIGGLAVEVALTAGATVTTPVIKSRRYAGRLFDDVTGLMVASDGAVWCGIGMPPEWTFDQALADDTIRRIAPDGTDAPVPYELHNFDRSTIEGWRFFERTGSGEVLGIAHQAGLVWGGAKFGPTGTYSGWTPSFDPRMPAASTATHLYVGNFDANGVQRFSPTSNLPTTVVPMPDNHYLRHVVPTAGGSFWVAGDGHVLVAGATMMRTTWIRRYDAAGALQATVLLPRDSRIDLVGDGAEGAWYLAPDGMSLIHLAADGTATSTTPLPREANHLHRAPSGDVWAYAGSAKAARTAPIPLHRGGADDLVVRVAPDGAIKARYHLGVGADVTELVVTAANTLWVGTGLVGLLEIEVGP